MVESLKKSIKYFLQYFTVFRLIGVAFILWLNTVPVAASGLNPSYSKCRVLMRTLSGKLGLTQSQFERLHLFHQCNEFYDTDLYQTLLTNVQRTNDVKDLRKMFFILVGDRRQTDLRRELENK